MKPLRGKDKFFEPVWDERKEAIKRTDEKIFAEFKERMKKGDINNRPKSKVGLIVAFSILAILFLIFTFLIVESLTPDTKIVYITTEKIIREQPIVNQEKVVNNITQYLQPENTADCIKVQAEGSDRYSMQCRVIKK